MTTYNVSIPNEKSSFFKEFLDLIGAKYTEENNEVSDFVLSEKQKSILTEQNDISVDDCIDAEEFYNILKKNMSYKIILTPNAVRDINEAVRIIKKKHLRRLLIFL